MGNDDVKNMLLSADNDELSATHTNEPMSRAECSTVIDNAFMNPSFILYGDGESYQNVSMSKISTTGNQTINKPEISATRINVAIQSSVEANTHIDIVYENMRLASLGIKGVHVDTEDGANIMLDLLNHAAAKVDQERSDFGAYTNRLEHAYNTNYNVEENTTAAESRIRDTDMAKEMVAYTSHNIIAQAGQSMLAQANQSKQGILALLG